MFLTDSFGYSVDTGEEEGRSGLGKKPGGYS